MNNEQASLIARQLAGESMAAELLEQCRRDPAVLEELARHVALERLLKAGAGAPMLAEEVVARLKYEQTGRPFAEAVTNRLRAMAGRRTSVPRWLAAAATLALLLGFGWLALRPHWIGHPTFARIVSIESVPCLDATPLAVDTRVGTRPIRIGPGFVQLRFDHGTLLLVEGPARFSLRNGKEVRLEYGRAVATVPLAGHGFRIESPAAEIIDLGTRFGVEVRPDGETEVHVLQGKVLVRGQWELRATELGGAEAVRVNSREKLHETVAADTDRFLTELPEPELDRPARYLHWPFDEGGGGVCRAIGVGMDGAAGTGRLQPGLKRDGGEADHGPDWVPGVLGSALFFDGQGDHVETGFPGIAGAAQRTVAFWVKAMPNEPLGFAALGWGTFSPGNVWQISLNPWAHEGTLGGLRLGIQPGEAVGRKNLCDGRWHHVAVVMYPGSETGEANLQTHTLLYVDGELEPTSRKSFQRIQTLTDTQTATPLMIGRSADSLHTPTFRGFIDELYVVDKALRREEIRRLMAGSIL